MLILKKAMLLTLISLSISACATNSRCHPELPLVYVPETSNEVSKDNVNDLISNINHFKGQLQWTRNQYKRSQECIQTFIK